MKKIQNKKVQYNMKSFFAEHLRKIKIVDFEKIIKYEFSFSILVLEGRETTGDLIGVHPIFFTAEELFSLFKSSTTGSLIGKPFESTLKECDFPV